MRSQYGIQYGIKKKMLWLFKQLLNCFTGWIFFYYFQKDLFPSSYITEIEMCVFYLYHLQPQGGDINYQNVKINTKREIICP